ncbi:hypothetical protein BH11MYX1_BH11MYX1_48550 [soil metagenome]
MQNSAMVLASFFVLMSACTRRVNVCESDTDCTKAGYPFCDVNGEYPASGGIANVCTVIPNDCPPERCGCTPGASVCNVDELTTCNADGNSATVAACALGCAVDNTRCATFAPSNNLGDALAAAAAEPDIDIPAGAVFDVATGELRDSGGLRLPIKSILVQQLGGVDIRVFIAKSFKIHDVMIADNTDVRSIALVATGSVSIDGFVNGGPHRWGASGAQLTTAACVGTGDTRGGGGGGNATFGGDAARRNVLPPPGQICGAGGAPQTTFEPLVGGCDGGGDAVLPFGGLGGAAIEIASLGKIEIVEGGSIDVGGGGGTRLTGGGSGGTVLLEAPTIHIAGKVTGNGGSGGACGNDGHDSTPDTAPAAAVGGCTSNTAELSGAGATGTTPARNGGSSIFPDPDSGAGGGGSVGRLQIKTADGTFLHDGGIFSIQISTATLAPQ